MLEGFTGYKKEDAEKYYKLGWWLGITEGDMLNKAADLCPDSVALVEDNTCLTYSQLREKVDKLAIGLIRLGIKKGDCVLVQLPNWAEFVYSYYALQKIGVTVVLLLSGHSQIEVSYLCSLTKATAWIVPGKWRKIDYLSMMNHVKKANRQLRSVILVREKEDDEFINFERLIQDADLNQGDIQEIISRGPDPGDVAVILPTGGTTGLPKAAPRTHNDHICSAIYKAKAFEMSSKDVGLIFTPVGHNLAMDIGLNPCILNYRKLVLLDSMRPEDFCEIVQKERVTYTVMVPTLASRIIDFERLMDYDLSSLTIILIGGSMIPTGLLQSVEEKLGCRCLNIFGMIEGPGCQVRLDDKPEIAYNTSGRPVCPYDKHMVIDEQGRELPPNMEGELVAKGPGIINGYFRSPEENKKAFTKDGFFRAGDLAIIDSEGNIKITGRIKDIIIRGGENISAPEVEGLIILHTDVEDVTVVAMPDEDMGEKVCAYIRCRSGARPSFEDIISFMENKGASKLLIPERIEFIDEIPLTKVGKPDKKALREDIKKRIEKEKALN